MHILLCKYDNNFRPDDRTGLFCVVSCSVFDKNSGLVMIYEFFQSVASTLSKGSKGLTADASSTDEAVLRNERDSGYGVPQSSYVCHPP